MPITQYDAVVFPNYGFISAKLSKTDLTELKNEVFSIKLQEYNTDDARSGLAGNIEKEFYLHKSKQSLETLLLPLCMEYNERFNYFKKIDVLKEPGKLYLDKLWVNFQQKHEFNPVHTHPGILSFVIWLDIPFKMKDELHVANVYQSRAPVPGHFAFLYTSIIGEIFTHSIPVDETYNETVVLFPSKLPHVVYPFYTSDKFRVTVSGNFKLKF